MERSARSASSANQILQKQVDSAYERIQSGQPIDKKEIDGWKRNLEKYRSSGASPELVGALSRAVDITGGTKPVTLTLDKMSRFCEAMKSDMAASFGKEAEAKLDDIQKSLSNGTMAPPEANSLIGLLMLKQIVLVDPEAAGLLRNAIRAGITKSHREWSEDIDRTLEQKGFWPAAYSVIATPGTWFDAISYKAITYIYTLFTAPREAAKETAAFAKNITPIGTSQLVRDAFRKAYENPTETNLAYFRISMYTLALDTAASVPLLYGAKPAALAAKTALVNALKKNLSKEALERAWTATMDAFITAQTFVKSIEIDTAALSKARLGMSIGLPPNVFEILKINTKNLKVMKALRTNWTVDDVMKTIDLEKLTTAEFDFITGGRGQEIIRRNIARANKGQGSSPLTFRKVLNETIDDLKKGIYAPVPVSMAKVGTSVVEITLPAWGETVAQMRDQMAKRIAALSRAFESSSEQVANKLRMHVLGNTQDPIKIRESGIWRAALEDKDFVRGMIGAVPTGEPAERTLERLYHSMIENTVSKPSVRRAYIYTYQKKFTKNVDFAKSYIINGQMRMFNVTFIANEPLSPAAHEFGFATAFIETVPRSTYRKWEIVF